MHSHMTSACYIPNSGGAEGGYLVSCPNGGRSQILDGCAFRPKEWQPKTRPIGCDEERLKTKTFLQLLSPDADEPLASEETLLARLAAHPEECSIPEDADNASHPLVIAKEKRKEGVPLPFQVIRHMFEILPGDHIDELVRTGRLGLSDALNLGAPGDVITRILDAKPKEFQRWLDTSTPQSDKDPYRALHRALWGQAPEVFIKRLLDADPLAARKVDAVEGRLHGFHPLHHALWNRASPGVVSLLLAADPGAERAVDYKGNLPLHHALKFAPVETVELILRVFPEAARHADLHGYLPLHFAARYSPSSVVKVLHAFPEAACRKSNALELVPADVVGSGSGAVRTLLQLLAKQHEKLLLEPWDDVKAGLCLLCVTLGPLRMLESTTDFAAHCASVAHRLQETDEEKGDEVLQLYQNVQQAAAVMLETALKEEDQRAMLLSPPGLRRLSALVETRCLLFLGRPRMQRLVHQCWWPAAPPRPFAQSRGTATTSRPLSTLPPWMVTLIAWVINLALLPIAAIAPPLEVAAARVLESERQRAREKVAEESEKNPPSSQGFGGIVPGRFRGSKYYARSAFDAAVATALAADVHLVDRWTPLLHPAGKFYVNTLANLIVVACLTFNPTAALDALFSTDTVAIQEDALAAGSIAPTGASFSAIPTFQVVFCAMALGGALDEVLCIARFGMHSWLVDVFNSVELAGFLSIATSLSGLAFLVLGAAGSSLLLAVGTQLLWMSQGLRLLQRSSTLGPLVQMLVQMTVDVGSWAVLLLPVLVGAASGMVVLFGSSASLTTDAEPLSEDCTVFDVRSPSGGALASMLYLFEISLGSDNPLGCLRESSFPVWAPAMMNFNLFVTLVVMVNVLIAQMAKTFDRVFEKSVLNFQFLKVRITLDAMAGSSVPAVLRFLSLPYLLVTGLSLSLGVWCARLRCYGARPAYEELQDTNAAQGEALAQLPNAEGEAEAKRKAQDEEDGVSLPERPAIGLTCDELTDAVDQFLISHIADALAQDEMIRKRSMRQVGDLDAKVVALSADVGKRVGGVERQMGGLGAQLTSLAAQVTSLYDKIETYLSSPAAVAAPVVPPPKTLSAKDKDSKEPSDREAIQGAIKKMMNKMDTMQGSIEALERAAARGTP
mmetsp:Transcript_24125/g.64718  ORF Transcript_24125/g.64718 Transcript_24125/m.64718 type:complete len:1127 (-) Transcript_24125:291-3671(-)